MAFARFEEINALMDTASLRFVHESKIVRYTNEIPGGSRAWRSTGFYARTKNDRRLVLEILHHDSISPCLVRVFLENPLEMHFSFKVDSSIPELEKLIIRGLDAFSDSFKVIDSVEPIDEEINGLDFSPEEIESIKRVLLPLPPPFKPEYVPNA